MCSVTDPDRTHPPPLLPPTAGVQNGEDMTAYFYAGPMLFQWPVEQHNNICYFIVHNIYKMVSTVFNVRIVGKPFSCY